MKIAYTIYATTDDADTGITVSSRLSGAATQKGEPMDDLISRKEAIEAMECVNDSICAQQAVDALCDLPTAEKVGMWIDEPVYKQTMDGKTWDGYTYCSECREMHEYGYRSNYCPNCGADMRGEE